MHNDKTEERILVLGIGNILWGDEGFGVRAVEELYNGYNIPENVTILDGGTQGLYLVHHIQEADKLIVFDAIDYGLKPGTMKLVEGDDVPKFTGAKKMSLHQTGFQEVLSAADLMGQYPEDILLIGVQPVDLEAWGGTLTPTVRARVQPAVTVAVNRLHQWGYELTKRARRLPDAEGLLGGSHIDLGGYDDGRETLTQGDFNRSCYGPESRILLNEGHDPLTGA